MYIVFLYAALSCSILNSIRYFYSKLEIYQGKNPYISEIQRPAAGIGEYYAFTSCSNLFCSIVSLVNCIYLWLKSNPPWILEKRAPCTANFKKSLKIYSTQEELLTLSQ
jgi:hypothetical protein